MEFRLMPNPLRHWLLILLACAFPFAVHAADPPFQEGKDYVRLPTPIPTAKPGQIEVVEMFSYTCPHCRSLEPAVNEWLARKPDNVTFVQVAVALGSSWEPTARAYYAAQSLGVLEKIHKPLFDAIHQEKRRLNNVDALAVFFVEQGVDEQAFRNAYSSFQTETQLRRGNQLAQRYGVRGVPAIIVNGKYDVRSPRVFEVVDFLISKEASPQS
jgi:thiol:disulfide interchange protein DsbA